MNVDAKRPTEPVPTIAGTFDFTEADVVAAFEGQTNPDEELFYAVFSGAWKRKTASERLLLLSQIAALVEAQAITLNVNAAVEPQ